MRVAYKCAATQQDSAAASMLWRHYAVRIPIGHAARRVSFDAPRIDAMPAFNLREEVEQPTVTVYNHRARPFRGAGPSIAASPAPPDIAVQHYNRGTMPTMQAKLQRGRTVGQAIVLGAGRVARIHPLIRVGRRRAQDPTRPRPVAEGR